MAIVTVLSGILHGDYCYEIVTNSVSWTKADTACKNLNADLASIHNDDEQSFMSGKTVVETTFLNIETNQYWVIWTVFKSILVFVAWRYTFNNLAVKI